MTMPVAIPIQIRSLVVLTFSKMQPSQVWSFHRRLGSNCNSFFELQSLMCSLTESAERHLQLTPLWPPQHLSLTQPFMSTSTPSEIALHMSSLPRSRHSCHRSNVKRKLEVIRKAVDKSIPRVVLELDTTCLERHASLCVDRFLDHWTNTQSAPSRPRTPGLARDTQDFLRFVRSWTAVDVSSVVDVVVVCHLSSVVRSVCVCSCVQLCAAVCMQLCAIVCNCVQLFVVCCCWFVVRCCLLLFVVVCSCL